MSIVQYELCDGDVYVEVGDDKNTDLIDDATVADEIRKAKDSFVDTVKQIAPAVNACVQGLKEGIIAEPQEISIELGIKFSSEHGIILSTIGSEVNLKLTVKWKQKND